MFMKLNLNYYLQYLFLLYKIRRDWTDIVKAHKIFSTREKYLVTTIISVLKGVIKCSVFLSYSSAWIQAQNTNKITGLIC